MKKLAIHGIWAPAIPAGATPTYNTNIVKNKPATEAGFDGFRWVSHCFTQPILYA
ncbi:hypothetical protein [Methylomonas methanica]|uniref:hypothetical protein n=1 Tax=Methylomonas methanica TaxID=421 RepID=UPI0012F6B7E4|nr:hypothetical protein [Methylomonas methanica]